MHQPCYFRWELIQNISICTEQYRCTHSVCMSAILMIKDIRIFHTPHHQSSGWFHFDVRTSGTHPWYLEEDLLKIKPWVQNKIPLRIHIDNNDACMHNSASMSLSWCRHQMETFSALLAICAGNSPVTGIIKYEIYILRLFGKNVGCGLNQNQWTVSS